jgi:hypothetical protein
MKIIPRILLAGLVALAGIAGTSVAGAQASSPDRISLDQLASSGSDLSKLHHFDFLLRFPTEKAAERAVSKLVPLAFEATAGRGKSGTEWEVRASKKLYPIESDLNGLRDKLNAIAAQEHGSYDGWKARVIERP